MKSRCASLGKRGLSVFFCFINKFKEIFVSLGAQIMLTWNEINSQGGKSEECCITEYYRCSDEGAIGLETH